MKQRFAQLLCLLAATICVVLPASRSQNNPTPIWIKQNNQTLARLTSLHFTDAQNGWAAGSNGTLLKTADGGANWQRVLLPAEYSRDSVRAVWAFDAHQLRLLGEYNLTQRPTSAGLSGRSFLLASADGGASWQSVELARPPEPAIRQPNRQRTTETEEDTVPRLASPILTSLYFTDRARGWLVGESGTIQFTRDGGASWQMQYAASRKLFYAVSALTAQQAWLAGGGGAILHTQDGGAHWDEQHSGTTHSLRAIQFVDAKHGWAAGANGTILSTIDSGARWQLQTSHTTETLNDIFFVNANEGWAAGERGTLLHTRDGGATWQDESLQTLAHFSKLFFVAPACGWVAGTNGSIYHYRSN